MKKATSDIRDVPYIELAGNVSCEPTFDDVRVAQEEDVDETRSFQRDLKVLVDEWNNGAKSLEEYCLRQKKYHARRIAYLIKVKAWEDPILLCKDEKTILDGLHRLKAAKHFGLKDVNVIIVNASPDLSADRKKRLWAAMSECEDIKEALLKADLQIIKNCTC